MKLLIIGLGSIARKHISALKDLGEFEIYAFRSSDKSASEPGVENIYSFDEIEKYNFDFYIISNPTSEHAGTIKGLLSMGKPLFIEKPIFSEVTSENDQLINEIVSCNIPTYVACNLRFRDTLREIKNIIEGYRINEVNVYCGSYLPNWRPTLDFRKNYSANKEMGGGVHIDLIHELDYLYWIFGEPLQVHSIFRNTSALDISAVDYANYLWEYKDFAANVILNYYRLDAKRTLEIVTTKATFMVDLLKNKIFKNGIEIYSSEQEFMETYTTQMEFFINNVVKGGNLNFNTAEEAYQILKLCLKK